MKLIAMLLFSAVLFGCSVSNEFFSNYLSSIDNNCQSQPNDILISNEKTFPYDYEKLVIDRVNCEVKNNNALYFEFYKPKKISMVNNERSNSIVYGYQIIGRYSRNDNSLSLGSYTRFSYLVMTSQEYKKLYPLYKKGKHIKLL